MNEALIIITIFAGSIVILLLGISVFLMISRRLKPTDWLEHPLGIPTGSVRALLALLIILLVVWAATTAGTEVSADGTTTTKEIPQWLIGIMGAVIGFYFGGKGITLARKEEKEPAKNHKSENDK